MLLDFLGFSRPKRAFQRAASDLGRNLFLRVPSPLKAADCAKAASHFGASFDAFMTASYRYFR